MVPWLGSQERAAVAEVVESGWVSQGPRVARFEREFAAVMQAPYAVATSSSRAAVHLALLVAGVRPGDDVVLPSLASIATADVVRDVGATPVFADVDPITGNVTGGTVARALTPATVAVVAVDQAGVPVDLRGIRGVTDPLGVIVVEDASGGAGSIHHGRPVGAEAEITAWSFHPLDILTTGEGGMLTTTHAAWAARAKRLREHGTRASPGADEPVEAGWDVRMTDLQAAIGLVQLGRLPEIICRRREIADRYRSEIADVAGLRFVSDPDWGVGNAQSFWVEVGEEYPLDRDGLLIALAEAGISAGRGLLAIHRHPPYRTLAPSHGMPGTERFTDGTLILPVHHLLGADEQDRVIAVLREPRSPAMAAADSAGEKAR